MFILWPVLCIVLVPLGTLPYLFGRLGWPLPTAICLLVPAIGVSIFYCFFVSLVKLIADWARCTWTKRVLFVIEVCLPIVFVGLFVAREPILARPPLWPDAGPFVYGLRDRVRSQADTQAIRNWLRTLDNEKYDEPGELLPREQWPESLKKLKPSRIYVSVDKDGNPEVTIIGGGGFHGWSVIIGTDLVIPESDLDSRRESWLLVEPGIYVCEVRQ